MNALLRDLPGVLVLTLLFCALLAAAELWRRFGRPRPEWTRKLVHLGGGLVCLLFPLLIRSAWTVLAMALALCALFFAGGRAGGLRSLHGVERRSRGVEYYPLAVFIVYLLARDAYWIYASAILVLAVADAGAALVGGRFGRVRYTVEDSSKSLEGSLVFLALSWLAVFVPAYALGGLSLPASLLAATLLAILLTGFEAISLGGTDNLFVPLAVCVILQKFSVKPLEEMIYQNVSLLVLICAQVAFFLRSRAFHVGGAIALVLFLYGAWSLGSEVWALPALIGVAAYAIWVRTAAGRRATVVRLQVRPVVRRTLVPFLLLLLANLYDAGRALYAPYVASCAVVTALALLPVPPGGRRGPARGVLLGAVACLLVAAPPALLTGAAWAALAVGVATATACTAGALYAAPSRPRTPAAVQARVLIASAAAAALVLAMQAAGWIAPWAVPQ